MNKAEKPSTQGKSHWKSLGIGSVVWVLTASSWLAACRVNSEDLKRWKGTEHGPDKLVAVLTHDKYEKELRIEAGWSLIEMKRRGGQTVGLTRLIEELIKMNAKDRREVVVGLWGRLAPKAAQKLEKKEGKYSDPSVVYKDALFEIWAEDKLDLDAKMKEEMARVLSEWCVGNEKESVDDRLQSFELRLENTGQKYGVEQLIRKLGVQTSKHLPELLSAKDSIKSLKLDVSARLAVDVKPVDGDVEGKKVYEKTREDVSVQLARIIKESMADGYTNAIKGEIEEALKKSPTGKEVLDSPEKFKEYLTKTRNERMPLLFTLAKLVGRKALVSTLLEIAANTKATEEQRGFSLAALEGNIDTTSDQTLTQLVAIVKSLAPDKVKSGALVRIRSFPPEKAIQSLYQLFGESNWKVRYDAATIVLGLMKKVGDKSKTTVKEFLEKLPSKPEQKMSLGEPSSYGKMLGELPKEMNAKPALAEALNAKSTGALLTGLGYILVLGTPADLSTVPKTILESKEPVPKCTDADDCNWKPGCPVPKAGGGTEDKEIVTVADYFNYCVKIQVEKRAKGESAAPAPAHSGSASAVPSGSTSAVPSGSTSAAPSASSSAPK